MAEVKRSVSEVIIPNDCFYIMFLKKELVKPQPMISDHSSNTNTKTASYVFVEYPFMDIKHGIVERNSSLTIPSKHNPFKYKNKIQTRCHHVKNPKKVEETNITLP